jgi:hypothetical protein
MHWASEAFDEGGKVLGVELERELAFSLPRFRIVVAQTDRYNPETRG